MTRAFDRPWDRFLDRLRMNGDDLSRSVALVLTVMGTLALLSFVMAGVVGAFEAHAPAPSAIHDVTPGGA